MQQAELSAPHPDGAAFLTAQEAADLLGVQRATLYSYVSRGWLKSVTGSSRERRYLREEVDRLKARSNARAGHGPVAAAALRWGDPVLETGITGITEAGPVYRGHCAVALARDGVSFEAVAELLWGGQLEPMQPAWPVQNGGLEPALLAQFRPPDTPIDLLRLAIPILWARGHGTPGLGAQAELTEARALIRRLAALCTAADQPERLTRALAAPYISQALAIAFGADETEEVAALLNAALVLSADHELNASTLSARVAASTGADLYACLSAAISTLSGPRHGGACARVEAMLDDASRCRAPEDAIRRIFSRGQDVPGFGHPLYPHGDPRARALLELAEARGGHHPAVRSLRLMARAMAAAGHPAPTLDFGLVAVAEAYRLPRGTAVALFAVGRMAGWIAHIQEQRRQGYLMRPTARYTGPPARTSGHG